MQDEDDAPSAVPLTSVMKGDVTHAPLSSHPSVATREAIVRHEARVQQGTADKAGVVMKPGAIVQEGVGIKEDAVIHGPVNKEAPEENSNDLFDAPSGMVCIRPTSHVQAKLCISMQSHATGSRPLHETP